MKSLGDKNAREVIELVVVVGTFIVLRTLLGPDPMDLRYALRGDEGGFFTLSYQIFQSKNLPTIAELLGPGVHEMNSQLVSWLQSALFFVPIEPFEAWKLTGFLAHLVATTAAFSLVRILSTSSVAWLCGILVTSSSYLIPFSQIPYPNLFGAVYFLLLLIAAELLARRPASLTRWGIFGFLAGTGLYIFAGVACGIGSYFYYLVRVRGLSTINRFNPLGHLIAAGVASLVWLPGLTNPLYISGLMRAVDPAITIWARIRNIPAFLVSPWIEMVPSHFVQGRLTNIFVTVGMSLALVSAVRDSRLQALLAAWAATSAVLGITSPYEHAPVTRLQLLVCPAIAISCLGYEKILSLRRWHSIPRVAFVALLSILSIIFYVKDRNSYFLIYGSSPNVCVILISSFHQRPPLSRNELLDAGLSSGLIEGTSDWIRNFNLTINNDVLAPRSNASQNEHNDILTGCKNVTAEYTKVPEANSHWITRKIFGLIDSSFQSK